MKSLKSTFSFFIVIFFLFTCEDDETRQLGSLPDTVVDYIASDNNLTSLLNALEVADLTSVLQSEGPYTVFAPTDEAFQTLLDSNSSWNAIDDIPSSVLSQVLLNHVVNSNVPSVVITSSGSGYVSTLSSGSNDNNLSMFYNFEDGIVKLNGGDEIAKGANVIVADNFANNGVVHIINQVLLTPTIADLAVANPDLSTLVAALSYVDQNGTPSVSPSWLEVVSDDTAGPFTLFAPTNTAFTDVFTELELSGLGEDEGQLNAETTDDVLTYHVINNANVTSTQLTSGVVTTIGGDITANVTNFTLTDSNDRVSEIDTDFVDIQALNGVLHIVKQVILPPLD